MHARGRPTPSSSNPGDRAGGKERTRGKKCCGHQCCPCAEEQDRDALWGRWDPDYGVGGTHRLRGFGAASGRADIAGAPPRGEGLLLLSVAATPIPTHARWVQWSQGRAIAGCSFGPPPQRHRLPPVPACTAGGVLRHFSSCHTRVWCGGKALRRGGCRAHPEMLAWAQPPGSSEGCSSAFRVLSRTSTEAAWNQPRCHPGSVSPRQVSVQDVGATSMCQGPPPRGGRQWPRHRAPCHGQLVAQSTAGMEGARVGVPQPQELLDSRVLSPPVLRSPGGRPGHGTKRGSRGDAHMLSAGW